MGAWFASGRIVDLVIGFVVVEAIALAAYRRATGKGIAGVDLVPNLVAGLLLMFALRLALVAAWWGWIALCLLLAGLAHGADLRRRWRH